eukprot:5376293-Heterocapsa_arctica.AAC.1
MAGVVLAASVLHLLAKGAGGSLQPVLEVHASGHLNRLAIPCSFGVAVPLMLPQLDLPVARKLDPPVFD